MAERAVLELVRAACVAAQRRAGVQADAELQRHAQPLLPLGVHARQVADHPEGGTAGLGGMVALRRRRVPHRHDAVAGVVDHHALELADAVGQLFHDVRDEPARLGRPEALRQAREAADVAEQDGDLALLAVEQARVALQLTGQVGREELLELDAQPARLRFLLLPGQTDADG